MRGNLGFVCNTLSLLDYICKDHMMDEFSSVNNIFYFQVYLNIYCNLDEKNFCCNILFILDTNYKYRMKDEYYF